MSRIEQLVLGVVVDVIPFGHFQFRIQCIQCPRRPSGVKLQTDLVLTNDIAGYPIFSKCGKRNTCSDIITDDAVRDVQWFSAVNPIRIRPGADRAILVYGAVGNVEHDSFVGVHSRAFVFADCGVADGMREWRTVNLYAISFIFGYFAAGDDGFAGRCDSGVSLVFGDSAVFHRYGGLLRCGEPIIAIFAYYT